MARLKRRTSQQVRDELALLEALEPVEEAHLAAKAEYQEAVRSGDLARARAAKARKLETGNRLNEIRLWLRREAAIVDLQTKIIPDLEARLSRPILVQDGTGDARDDTETRAALEAQLNAYRAELEVMSREAAAYRAELEALGGEVVGEPVPPDLPPGSAHVTLPPVVVEPTVNGRRGKRGAK